MIYFFKRYEFDFFIQARDLTEVSLGVQIIDFYMLFWHLLCIYLVHGYSGLGKNLFANAKDL